MMYLMNLARRLVNTAHKVAIPGPYSPASVLEKTRTKKPHHARWRRIHSRLVVAQLLLLSSTMDQVVEKTKILGD